MVELETHKVITKVGEVELNLARILKDRNGNLQTFRIAKCYDSYANIKMSITFESQLPKLNHIVDYQPSDVGKRMNDETIVFLEQKIEEDLRRISTLELANK